MARPVDIASGHLTGLLGVFYAIGGSAVLLGWPLGLYDGGRPALVAALGLLAVLVGGVLVVARRARPHVDVYTALAILGAVLISLMVAGSGPVGAAVVGLLFLFGICFTFIALSSRLVLVNVIAAALHLGALWWSEHPMALGVWMMTWVVGLVLGGFAGAVVRWLQRSVERLREADEHKSRFIATVSHELRTPLTAILGSTQTLLERGESLDGDHGTALVEMIDRNATRQLRLVEDVLAFSADRAEMARPQSEAVDVPTLVREMAASLPFGVEVVVRAEPVVLVDPRHLEQMLTNLLSNAEKYGAPPISVHVDVVADRGIIDVVDQGEGLPGGLDGELAEPFVQGDSGDRRVSRGVGLGLTICRDLAAANNGSLEYLDRPDRGATFRLHLPVTSSRTGPRAAAPADR